MNESVYFAYCIYNTNSFLNLNICSVEIRWPRNYGGLQITIEAKQVSSHDWFGIGFSVGNQMVSTIGV